MCIRDSSTYSVAYAFETHCYLSVGPAPSGRGSPAMNSRGPRGGRKLLCSYAGRSKLARVAELADAQASGACARKGVRVQVPPRAHKCLRVLAGLS